MSTKDKIGWFLIAFGVYSFFQGGSLVPSIVAPVDPNSVAVQHDGFHVVFTKESGTPSTWFYELLASPAVTSYLDTHCAGGKNGWRQWDKDEAAPNAPPALKELAALPEPSIPAVAISANKRAVVLPVGKQTDAELLATLKKYGGE